MILPMGGCVGFIPEGADEEEEDEDEEEAEEACCAPPSVAPVMS